MSGEDKKRIKRKRMIVKEDEVVKKVCNGCKGSGVEWNDKVGGFRACFICNGGGYVYRLKNDNDKGG